jgi:pimeloyl-ACP methyl ester carboxylesterase
MSSASLPALDNTVRLSDGRALGYAEYGDRGGRPVFYFHGTPGSRLVGAPSHEIAGGLGVWLIAPDRPGFGLSDFQPGRRYLDWPADVSELADNLGIQRFAVLGVSGGAPHVAAVAHEKPERVTGAAIVSGIAPLAGTDVGREFPLARRLAFSAGRYAPSIMSALTWTQAQEMKRSPERALARLARSLSPSDREVLARPESAAAVREAFGEAFRQGSQGVAWEFVMAARPWGFRLEEIDTPVHVWHGEEDRSAPAAMGRYFAATIPHARATFLPGEGHFLIADHIAKIIEDLVGKPK